MFNKSPMRIILSITLLFAISGCYNQEYASPKAQLKYQNMRDQFDSGLSDHFPEKKGVINTVITSLNTDKNNVGIILYNYEINSDEIKKIASEIENKAIAIYQSTDECMLIVNRFETLSTSENREVIKDVDSIQVNKTCFDSLYPIPNFIDVKTPVLNSEIKLNESYIIYVLDAKSGVFYKDLQLIPSPQMPDKWKNGFSKGIAISEKEGTVIYWGIIW